MTSSNASQQKTYELSPERADQLLSGNDEAHIEWLNRLSVFNLMKATPKETPFAYKICSGLEFCKDIIPGEEFSTTEEFPLKKKGKDSKSSYPLKNKPERNSVDEGDWEFLFKRFQEDSKTEIPSDEKSVVISNLENLSDHLKLNDIEKKILIFFGAASESSTFLNFLNHIAGEDVTRLPAVMSRLIGCPERSNEVARALDRKSLLMTSGLLTYYDQTDDDIFYHTLEDNIVDLIRTPNLNPETFTEDILGKPTSSDLDIADFSFLSQEIATMVDVVKKAVERGEKGINILLHGPAGSGKTALAATIAKELGMAMYAVGEDDDKGDFEGKRRTTSNYRTSQLFQAQNLLKGKKNVLLFFDEIEDLLIKSQDSSKSSDTESKIVVNRLMENNETVTIWAGNDPDKFHESLRQRFSYALYVDYPPVMIRKALWQKRLDMQKVTLDDKDVTYLARHYVAPPRLIANSIRLASLSDFTVSKIEEFLHSSSKITYGDSDSIRSRAALSNKFDVALANYDLAQENRLKAIIALGPKPMPYSMLMQGPQGTGLKSMARYLAEGSVMNTAEFDMRDLVSTNTQAPPEAKIRGVFQAANDAKNILVISNIDALSPDAGSSSAKWNEDGLADLFTRCAYDHKLPMIATCYKPDIQIPGFVRDAFSVGLTFSPLTEEQGRKAFDIYFNRSLVDQKLPSDLVPADFARVAKIVHKGLNGETPVAEIVGMLRSQITNRTEHSRVGFSAQ